MQDRGSAVDKVLFACQRRLEGVEDDLQGVAAYVETTSVVG